LQVGFDFRAREHQGDVVRELLEFVHLDEWFSSVATVLVDDMRGLVDEIALHVGQLGGRAALGYCQ